MPVVGLVAGAVGSIGSAVAGGVAAGQQRSEAERQQSMALQMAAPTQQELTEISRRLEMQTRYQTQQEVLQKKNEKILSTLDPALIQAGQQAHQMMKGQQAGILAPMRQQQSMDRRKLEAQLAAQFGPGYASSSAGMEALARFDQNSQMGLQQAQMQAFNQVSQFMGFGMQSRQGMIAEQRHGMESLDQMSRGTLGAMNNIQRRQVDAITGTSQGMVASAGAGAKAVGGMFGAMQGLGGMAMGGAFGQKNPWDKGFFGGGDKGVSFSNEKDRMDYMRPPGSPK